MLWGTGTGSQSPGTLQGGCGYLSFGQEPSTGWLLGWLCHPPDDFQKRWLPADTGPSRVQGSGGNGRDSSGGNPGSWAGEAMALSYFIIVRAQLRLHTCTQASACRSSSSFPE